MVVLKIVAFCFGLWVVLSTLLSAIRTFVLPRSAPDRIARLVYLSIRGVPMKPDRDQAWRDFNGWRVNYDVPLLALARLTMAPPDVPWSTDAPRRKLAGKRTIMGVPTMTEKHHV